MKNEFLLAIGQLAAEKNLDKEIIFSAVEAALASAYKREGENTPNVVVQIDQDSGSIRAYMQKVVAAEVEHPEAELSLEEAKRYKPDAQTGDVLDFEFKPPEDAGRIAAQTAKQVVLQRLREAERDAVFEEYNGKEDELVTGTVQRMEARQVILEIGKGIEAAIPGSEQIRHEHLRPGQRAKVVILEVNQAAKGPQIIASRSHRNLLRRLFETEVPEITNGRVEIRAIAREGGHRSKVAVHARVPSIDPIGACVGPRGARIQNVVNELGGERVDIIKWDADEKQFLANALSPAEVVDVQLDEEGHRATLTVPDSMLSLAIGKEGQNARLAAKLTGWWIDVRSQSGTERAAEDEAAIAEAPASFEPYREGEEPDLDILNLPDPTPLEPEPVVAAPAPVPTPAAATAEEPALEVAEDAQEEDFALAVQTMDVPDEEERESEEYGEEYEEDDEEYEVPAMLEPEERPTAIRFAEDVLPGRDEEEEQKPGDKKKKKRGPRRYEEEDEEFEDIDYSGRIH